MEEINDGLKKRACPVCKTLFGAKVHWQIYCAEKCGVKIRATRHWKKKLGEIK